jgi:hypothetical protein
MCNQQLGVYLWWERNSGALGNFTCGMELGVPGNGKWNVEYHDTNILISALY